MSQRPAKLMPDAQALADASMTTEAAFQVRVIELLRLHGYRTYHTFDSRRSAKGFPDIIAVRGRRLMAIELKVGKRKPTPEQMEWLLAFGRVEHVDAFVLRDAPDWSEFERVVAA